MWPLIIGAVSQATDPAKKLADAYYSHAISLGFTVNYATIYAIYRDEILTDENYSKLLDVSDFRGAKYASGDYFTRVMSMIPPYDILNFSAQFHVDSNGLASPVGTVVYAIFDFVEKYNFEDSVYVREVLKVWKPADVVSSFYYTVFRGINGVGVFYTRMTSTEYMYFYLYSTTGALNQVQWANNQIPEGDHIFEHIVDKYNLIHRGYVDEIEKDNPLTVDFIPNKLANDVDFPSVMYIYNQSPQYWRKYYRP